ncbi:MAG: endonuclease domain-containing protein [Hyphomicrobiales bacterium]|nr:MAG: endonuclease domain-containing protein [Hyphomicrobiales bacterium]
MRSPVQTLKRAKKLRREMTLPEVVLWTQLRKRAAGMHFRRQHAIGPYVLDFYCSAARLCVEVDGASHNFAAAAAHDTVRDRWLAAQGIRILRFAAADVLNDDALSGVMVAIQSATAPSTAFGGPPPP